MTAGAPDYNDEEGDDERPGGAQDLRRFARENTKRVLHDAEHVALFAILFGSSGSRFDAGNSAVEAGARVSVVPQGNRSDARAL